ncbi:hypothetical protein FBQ82_15735 [Anaerolineae bacterium CFX7]|nr:hypothetical protein [Anaerolineae bacterium CFX7]
MDDTITLYSNQDLTTLVRSFDVGALAEPSDELTGRYEYIVLRAAFRDAYQNWDRGKSLLLRIHDELSDTDIYLGKPSAQRVHDAIAKRQASVQLF